jgi:hypothetical protein
MTRRQQLILFVLGLATVSICTVGFAMAMNLGRHMAVSRSAVERLPAAESESEEGLAWQMPSTPVASSPIVPSGPEGQPAFPPTYTSTPTRPPTPTNTRVPTWTPSPTRTPTVTRVPTDTPVPTPTSTSPAPPPSGDADSGASAPAPAPAVPTPTPEFPFEAMVRVFDTGAPQMTRVTGMVWKIVDINLALYDAEPGYQMRLVDPSGRVHLSDVSGIGSTDSTCRDCGDNSRMNMKIEIPPYLPGTYHLTLVQEETQMSQEVEFTLAANPQQYVHVNFVPWQ